MFVKWEGALLFVLQDKEQRHMVLFRLETSPPPLPIRLGRHQHHFCDDTCKVPQDLPPWFLHPYTVRLDDGKSWELKL